VGQLPLPLSLAETKLKRRGKIMATVYVPSPLRRLTGGLSKVQAQGADVAELLEDLEVRYPGLRQRICEADGEVKRFVNLFVNGDEIRTLRGLRTPLSNGDEVFIIPAMSGGRRPQALAIRANSRVGG
jgi:molybdopterin synthase sulfur carrier subunit